MSMFLYRTRSLLTLTAVGVLSAALLVAISPSLPIESLTQSEALADPTAQTPGFDFASVVAGVMLGLLIGTIARFEWSDIPRRVINWVLVRERQFYYGALLSAGLAIIILY